jgi:hypothetical protein
MLDAARALLASGYEPDAVIPLRHAGSNITALISTVGQAARLHSSEVESERARLARRRDRHHRAQGQQKSRRPPTERISGDRL